jgi:hypothetical protein
MRERSQYNKQRAGMRACVLIPAFASNYVADSSAVLLIGGQIDRRLDAYTITGFPPPGYNRNAKQNECDGKRG